MTMMNALARNYGNFSGSRQASTPNPSYAIGIGTAAISIKDDATIPVTLSLARLNDGSAQRLIKGQPGRQHILESSPDLIEWAGLKTNVPFTDTWTVLLPIIGPKGKQFYRVVRSSLPP